MWVLLEVGQGKSTGVPFLHPPTCPKPRSYPLPVPVQPIVKASMGECLPLGGSAGSDDTSNDDEEMLHLYTAHAESKIRLRRPLQRCVQDVCTQLTPRRPYLSFLPSFSLFSHSGNCEASSLTTTIYANQETNSDLSLHESVFHAAYKVY